MSKFIIAIIACVSLSGCFYQTVNQYDINRAIALCGSVANIHQIDSYYLGRVDATCYSGEQVSLGGIKGERK
jgi:uncharacterized membrane protein YjjB (DUF3815 family)